MKAIEKLHVVFKRAIKSGWEEVLSIPELMDGSGFKLLKKSGTGTICINCTGEYFWIEKDKYFLKALNEEKEKCEYGHYSFLADEAVELLEQFRNTYEGKAVVMYDNILGLLEKGKKIFVLNDVRRRECSENKQDYLIRKIKESLRVEHKIGYWSVK